MEQWRKIKGFEELYEVSSEGRVRSLDRYVTGVDSIARKHFGKVLSPGFTHGYAFVYLNDAERGRKRRCYVHRLVGEAFIPNPQNLPQINHKDECRAHNNVRNLEWCNAKYNINYGKHTHRVGEALSIAIVAYDMYAGKTWRYSSAAAASRELSLDTAHIAKVLKGKSNSHKGYIFMYEDQYSSEKMKEKYDKANINKPIIAKNNLGQFIHKYRTRLEAAQDLNIDGSEISKVLYGKSKHVKGYQFSFCEYVPPASINVA